MKQEAHAAKLSITSIATRNACPVCIALREFQSDLLRHLKPEECERFCSAHGWLVANSAPGESVAVIFLRAIANRAWRPASPLTTECDLCKKMHDEKEKRLLEVVEQFREPRLRSWLQDYGMLCSRHAREVMAKVPEALRESIQEVIERNSEEITEVLGEYLQRVKQGNRGGGGVLGRAAEFLFAHRGIET